MWKFEGKTTEYAEVWRIENKNHGIVQKIIKRSLCLERKPRWRKA